MTRVWRRFKRSWLWVAIFGVLTVVGWVLFGALRRRPDPLKAIANEMRVINAKRDVVKAMNSADAQAATAKLLIEHQERAGDLDDAAEKRATELQEDPEALAEYFARRAAG